MKLLIKHGCSELEEYIPLVQKISAEARGGYERDGVGNGLQCDRERAYLELELELQKEVGNEERFTEFRVEIAESNVRQASGVIEANWPMARSVAAHYLEEAIEEYRKTGGYKERIQELRHELQRMQRGAVAELAKVSVTGNAGEAAKFARETVAGKPALPALFGLAFGYHPPPRAELEDEVRLKFARPSAMSLLPQFYIRHPASESPMWPFRPGGTPS